MTVAGAGRTGPALAFFYSTRSGRSRRVDSFLANVLQRGKNQRTFNLIRVPVEDHPDLAARFRVESAPTLLVIEDGRVRGRLESPRGTQEIRALLSPWLQSRSTRSAANATDG
jgi:thioredoxin-like negative regulator of GroEL